MERDQVVKFVDSTSIEGLAYLMLLLLLHSATVSELVLITRGDRGTIQKYLNELEMRGLVLKVQAGHAFQWFPSETAGAFMPAPTVGIPDSKSLTAAAAPPLPAIKPAAALAVRSTVEHPDSKFDHILPQLRQAFKNAGIGRNAWQKLADCNWITPEFVRRHDGIRRKQGHSVGMLITRLLADDPIDESLEVGGDRGEAIGRAWQKVLEQQKTNKAGQFVQRLRRTKKGGDERTNDC